MSKKIKTIAVVFVAVIIILPVVFCVSIVITNNVIADNVEKRLVACSLPQSTQLVESQSAAGKLTGNGNGMQYMGAILVTSELSEQQLKDYYGEKFGNVKVTKQESPEIEWIHPDYKDVFKNFSATDGKTYYSVISFDDNRKENFSDFICQLLDLDLRGH